ncbi:P-loop containing nucleoside triphosphate hydrolase protein, partial [Mycena metata]
MSSPQWIDRRNARRTVPLQVLCLGVARTGTSSMTRALETLGYVKTNHGMAVFTNPSEVEMWTEAINAKFFGKGRLYVREDWDRLLGHCQAVTDSPHYLFAKELIEAYPEAKVVLTIRDPDSWWRSANATFVPTLGTTSLLRRVHGWFNSYAAKRQALGQLTFTAFFGTENWKDDEELCKARFMAHYDYVRSLVPPGRLLEFDVKQGWAPLCRFLGKKIPDEPFPRLFDTAAWKSMVKRGNSAAAKTIFAKLAPILVAGCGVVIYFYILGK